MFQDPLLIYVKHLYNRYLRILSFVLSFEMKKFLYIIVPVLTFACGFFLRGMFLVVPEVEKEVLGVKKVHKERIDSSDVLESPSKEKKKDKAPEEQNLHEVEIELDNDTLNIVDTLELFSDTMLVTEDSIIKVEEAIKIGRDRMVQSQTYQIKKRKRVLTSLDSLKDEGLNIREESFGKTLLIEFWESPINFTGYKLGKSKLVLYGINPQSKIQIEETGKDSLKLFEGDVLFNFVKTQEFKPINAVLKD